MPWYLWKRGDYVPDYSIGKNESLVRLCAKTLEEAKEEIGLNITKDNCDYFGSRNDDIVSYFRSNKDFYVIEDAKLLFVEQEIDLEEDLLAAQERIKEFRAENREEQLKQKRYEEYLKLQKEFTDSSDPNLKL